MQQEQHNNPVWPVGAVALVMAAGLALRLYGLRAESAWWDEYASLAFLDAPSLMAFLERNRTLDPATLPLYFVLEYFWAHWVSASVYGLRLLSIGIGVAAIPVTYALGARLYGRHAGYAAALCLALSPIHIHHSQGIRMYGLLALLGVASFWSLVRMLQQGKRAGWWLHGGVSLLLYWTHPFALLVPAAQGVWLLLHRRTYRRMLPGWILMQAMLALPVVGYVLSIRFWPQETTRGWLAAPGLGALLADLFFDDIISFHWQLRLGDIGMTLGAVRVLGDGLFAVVIMACLAYWGYVMLRREATPVKRHTALLLCWVLLPPLALFIVSLLWRPCMFPRYTVHCAVGLYLLLGGTVQQLRHREWRGCAYALLAGLFLFQWLITLPGPQRTDWQSAARHIHAGAKPADITLVNDLLWRDVFAYNAAHVAGTPLEAPVAAAANTTLLAAQSALFLGMADTEDAVWAVVAADYFETAPPLDFEQELAARQLDFDRVKFNGIRDVYVYRITPQPDAALPLTLAAALARQHHDATGLFAGYLDHAAMQAFAALADALAQQGRADAALELLRELFQVSPFAEQVYGNMARAIADNRGIADVVAAIRALWDGYGFRENQRFERARQSFAQALALDPQSGIAALELGLELAGLGRYTAAADALELAAALNKEYAELVDNLVAAIRAGQDRERAYQAVFLCRDALIVLSKGNTDTAMALFQQALSEDPQLPRAQVMLGFLYALQERYDDAFTLFTAYLVHGKYHSPIAYTHLALIHILRDEPEEALAHAQKAMELDEGFKRQMEPLINALLIEKDYPRVMREMERLEREGVTVPLQFKEYLHKRAVQ